MHWIFDETSVLGLASRLYEKDMSSGHRMPSGSKDAPDKR
jgi:hypothetical protein